MKFVLVSLLFIASAIATEGDYLRWTLAEASKIANVHRTTGQVGGSLDFRVVATDRSYNYKLRATWMTPDAIRANARLQQLSRRLSDADTRALVAAADHEGETVVMVELHGREGSGVIPSSWQVTLGPKGGTRISTGVSHTEFRDIPALAGAQRRDYAYDVFWVAIPLRTAEGARLFEASDTDAELTVRIYDKVGRIHWQVPQSLRGQ
jgi:hypothetical protein